ncbi:hypothetical protein L9F63_000268 [Diploptera punctata]|uniref:Uncharacterized protein n=1 Tax=Diploptera punctata TaxID=6984 RepID=A0AAD8ESH0_DIPPU|nr:hypothetical protein L9F63_000268 [Diploptera punctata]
MIFRFADRILWTLEVSIQWFVKNDKRKVPTVRPLPWIIFLPFLLWLRFLKIGLDFISFIRRKETLPLKRTVGYIHMYRQRLRGMKHAGLKNMTCWRMIEEKKRKELGECIVMKMFGIYWFLAFTGLGRFISSETSQKKHLNTIEDVSEVEQTTENMNEICERPAVADKSQKSSETEFKLENVKQNCEESNKDDPNCDSLADESDGSEDNSDKSSLLSMETAEADSGSTSQTFYSSTNITPEPILPPESQTDEYEIGNPPSTEDIYYKPLLHEECEQRLEKLSSQNENCSKQLVHEGQILEDLLLHEESKSNKDESWIDVSTAQTFTEKTEKMPEETMCVTEKQGIDSIPDDQLANTSHEDQQLSLKEEESQTNMSQSHKTKDSIEQINYHEERSEVNKTDSVLVEDKQNGQNNDNKLLSNKQYLNLKREESESNISDFSQSIQEISQNSAQKNLETPNYKESSDSINKLESSESKQKNEINIDKQNNDLIKIDNENIRDFKIEPTGKLNNLSKSDESLENHQTSLGNASSNFIKLERSMSLPPITENESAVISAMFAEPVELDVTHVEKPKRRFADFFISKKKT